MGSLDEAADQVALSAADVEGAAPRLNAAGLSVRDAVVALTAYDTALVNALERTGVAVAGGEMARKWSRTQRHVHGEVSEALEWLGLLEERLRALARSNHVMSEQLKVDARKVHIAGMEG